MGAEGGVGEAKSERSPAVAAQYSSPLSSLQCTFAPVRPSTSWPSRAFLMASVSAPKSLLAPVAILARVFVRPQITPPQVLLDMQPSARLTATSIITVHLHCFFYQQCLPHQQPLPR